MEQARINVLIAANPPPTPVAISGALAIFRFPLAVLAIFGLLFSVQSSSLHNANWMLLTTSFVFSLPAVLCAVLLTLRFRQTTAPSQMQQSNTV